jgi:hypothetical protein
MDFKNLPKVDWPAFFYIFFIGLVICLITFLAIDCGGGKTVYGSGVIQFRKYTPSRHWVTREMVEDGKTKIKDSKTGETVKTITHYRSVPVEHYEPEKYELSGRCMGHSFVESVDFDVFGSVKEGDFVNCSISKGMFTNTVWSVDLEL